MKKLRIMALMHPDLVPLRSGSNLSFKTKPDGQTESDVLNAFLELGHEVITVGVGSDLKVIDEALINHKPHLAFNLLEEFDGNTHFDQHVVSYLELMRLPYTGANPLGLTLCRNKALCKQILLYHRIPTPHFFSVPKDHKFKTPKNMRFPLIVKSLVEEASLGISQASLVSSVEKLTERVQFIHESIQTPAIVEEYIEGRELYVGVLGNRRLETLPVWELWCENLPDSSAMIATQKIKWDENYQKKIGLQTGAARDLSPELQNKILKLVKRAYVALNLSGYARFDLRLNAQNEAFILEVNPNPDLGAEQEFALSAKASGISYPQLVQKILSLGKSYTH